jgi:hypothetical protein
MPELRRGGKSIEGGKLGSDRRSYVPAFDGLRGVAVLPVVLLHVGVEVLPDNGLLRELTRGWYGVDLFFCPERIFDHPDSARRDRGHRDD